MTEPSEKPGTLKKLAEDASGFGMADLRLTRDLVLLPSRAMAAYDEHGSTGGGRYPRPLRYYLTLNGVFLLLMAMLGGMEQVFTDLDTAGLFDELARFSGKSRDEFMADFDQWFSLLSVPVMTLTLVLPVFWLISRWSPLDWRRDLNQTFTFLNAWTLYQLPFTVWFFIDPGSYLAFGTGLMLVAALVVYGRVGAGRWWRTGGGAIGKGLVLALVILVAMAPAAVLTFAGAFAGAAYAP